MARLVASNRGHVKRTEVPSKVDQVAHDLSDALSKIERVSQALQRFSVVVLSATIISFVVLFAALLIGERQRWGFNWLAAWSLLLGCIALYGCASHEMWRRRGDGLFEEISDEVERRVVAVAGGLMFEGESDLLLRVRKALRDFTRAGDLPFIPGKFGPTVYAAVNLLIPILILFSSYLLKP